MNTNESRGEGLTGMACYHGAMNWRTWTAFVALGVVWGVPYFFIKLAVREVSPFVVAWGRIALAAAVLLPIAWQRGGLLAMRSRLLPLIALSLCEFAIPYPAISMGERWVSSSVTAILIAATPLTIVALSRFFGVQEHLSGWRLAGLTLGLAGVVGLVGLGGIDGTLGWVGVGCMLVAITGYACGGLLIQRHFSGMEPTAPIALSLGFAALVLLPSALLSLPRHRPSLLALGSIVLLGLLCTAIAMLLMFYLIRQAGAARAAVITYINPAVASVLGVLLLHEQLGLGGMLAFALILIGSWLSTHRAPPDRAATPRR
jgi:drug/metabolite transporter (DMT)-like permease